MTDWRWNNWSDNFPPTFITPHTCSEAALLPMRCLLRISLLPRAAAAFAIDVKKRFFYFVHVFYFPNIFFNFKKVSKVQSGKQINKKHFQNNSNETDLIIFCCMSDDLKCLPINFYLLITFDALCGVAQY